MMIGSSEQETNGNNGSREEIEFDTLVLQACMSMDDLNTEIIDLLDSDPPVPDIIRSRMITRMMDILTLLGVEIFFRIEVDIIEQIGEEADDDRS